MTPEQCRAARGWLEWSQTRLAARAGVSMGTINAFENGKANIHELLLKSIVEAIEDAGISFITNGILYHNPIVWPNDYPNV